MMNKKIFMFIIGMFAVSLVAGAASFTLGSSSLMDDFTGQFINLTIWDTTNTTSNYPTNDQSAVNVSDGRLQMKGDGSLDLRVTANQSDAADFNGGGTIWFNATYGSGSGTSIMRITDGITEINLLTITTGRTNRIYRVDIDALGNSVTVRENASLTSIGDLASTTDISALSETQAWSWSFFIDSTGGSAIQDEVFWFNFTNYGDPNVVLTTPTDNNVSVLATTTFNASITPDYVTPNNYSNSNASLFVWYANGTIFNNTLNHTLTGNNTNATWFSVANFQEPGNYLWNVFACTENVTDSLCAWSPANNSMFWGIGELTTQFSVNTAETADEVYNVTFNVSSGTPTADFYFGATKYAGSATEIQGNQWRFNHDSAVPIGTGSKTIIWEITTLGVKYNISKTQTVALTNFSLCGVSPQTVPYINFTFKNETTTEQEVFASIASTWTYRLGTDADVNKTLSFSDATERQSYAFCGTPADRNFKGDVVLDYDNVDSEQRTYSLVDALITNVTTNQVLYLLPTILGQFTTYQTSSILGSPISGVLATVTRLLNGNTINVLTQNSDGSGTMTLYLNPDISYSYVFSKNGYLDTVESLKPSSPDTYIVTMVSSSASNVTGPVIANNLSIQIFPLNSTLKNNTDYVFGINLTTNQAITSVLLNITFENGTQAYPEITGTAAGFFSATLNTINATKLIGTYVVTTANETLTGNKVWIIGQNYAGDYSIFKQMVLFNDFGFRDIWKILFVILTIFGVVMLLSSNEVLDTSESKVLTVTIMVWIFSVVGWLDIAAAVGTGTAGGSLLGTFAQQYGIAIVTSFIAFYLVFRRIMR